MAITLTVDQLCPLAVEFVDRAGNVVGVDGAPVWTSSDETIATVTVADDGLSATVVTVDNGTAQVTVKADARMGDEVLEIFATLDVEVLPGEAQLAAIAAGAPVAKP